VRFGLGALELQSGEGLSWSLDELVSQRLPLEQINRAFEGMTAGRVARSVITLQENAKERRPGAAAP
jgi:hypothetical protein